MNNSVRTPSKEIKAVLRLRKQLERARQRYTDAEEALDAIRHGTVDALVVYTEDGEKIYTIQGAETTYRLMVESINEGAATLIEDGAILYCNQRFAQMLGKPLESLIATSIHSYIANDQKDAFSSLMARGIKENCREESTFIRSNGERLPVMVSFNNFSPNDAPGVCLVATDLTASKKAEQVIRDDVLRAESMAELTRALVEASLDEAAIIRLVSHSAMQLIGDACIIRILSEKKQTLRVASCDHPSPHTTQLIQEILSVDELPVSQGISGRVFQSGVTACVRRMNPATPNLALRQEFPGLSGQLDIYSLLALPIRTRDQTIGIIELLRLEKGNPYDADDQNLAVRFADHMSMAVANARLYNDLQTVLRVEQGMRLQLIQAEKLTALNRMMATVVHEINNPVQTIKNCIYLAETEAQPGSILGEYLGMASSEINRITKLVAGLRDIYRQPISAVMEMVELSRMIADVHLLLEQHLQHQNVAWQQSLSGDHLWVNAIPDQLKQVILNLSLNAIEAMQPDGGTLGIAITIEREKNEVGLAVADTGPGIDPAHLERIFEPFYTTKEGGSGLGLSICYEIVQQHSGHIDVESRPGNGATFTVWLPLAIPLSG